MITVDLHTHTTASDGKLSPIEVVLRAKKNNVKCLAITDHDITSGLDEAKKACIENNILFIPGIELTTNRNNESVHVLGFFKDDSYKCEEFQSFLKNIKTNRENRALQIVKNLKKFFDINIDYDKVLELGNGVIARPHIARAIIDAGYDYSFDYIFDKFLSDSSPAYVPNLKVSTDEGISLLKKYNALTFLAHPLLLKKNNVKDLINLGFDGIEALYYLNSRKDTDKFISLAVYNDLLISCGSDFHGHINDSKHGDIGSMKIDNDVLNKLLIALNRKERF